MDNNPLTRRRKEMGISQLEVANYLNISQQHYSRIEKGNGEYVPYIKKLCKFFKCKENELWSGEYLNKIQNDFLKDFNKKVEHQFHEKKQGYVYINIKGWFEYSEYQEQNKTINESIKEWEKHMKEERKKYEKPSI